DVMHIVAVEIHGATAGRVLEPDALGADDGIEARGRHRLAQEIFLVFGEQPLRCGVEILRRPCSALWRQVGVALGFGNHTDVIPGERSETRDPSFRNAERSGTWVPALALRARPG